MNSIIRIFRSGVLIHETDTVFGDTLLQHIGAVGVFLDSPCGGEGKCGKCLVRLSTEGEQVLACRTRIDGDMSVYLPDDMEMEIAGAERQCTVYSVQCTNEDGSHEVVADSGIQNSKFKIQNLRSKTALGVAVDIGTTTVVAHLTDLETGERIATLSGVNAQRTYGADVISRIRYCTEYGHETLTQLIREQLGSMILDMCSASGVRADSIEYILVAGNTIMEHLAAGYSPVGMGTVPFTPISLFGEEIAAGEDLPVSETAKIFFSPAIASYVGGDVTAGLLAAGFEDAPHPAVYVDIGTNGEIVLKTNGVYYCCATAAGPAFEGAEITQGMAAVNGAINHIKWDDGLSFSVIGGSAARGLCGSGLLDALAVLLETGAVDETGRLLDGDEIGHDISKHIDIVDGKNVFRLTMERDGVIITSSDIRKLQLAKSAIAAGIQTLLHHAGIVEGQVRSFVLAGGFGSYMDQYSAAKIGLFPNCFLPFAQALGNTAGEGASIALCSRSARARLGSIRDRCEYVELSTSPVFNEQFVEQMMF